MTFDTLANIGLLALIPLFAWALIDETPSAQNFYAGVQQSAAGFTPTHWFSLPKLPVKP